MHEQCCRCYSLVLAAARELRLEMALAGEQTQLLEPRDERLHNVSLVSRRARSPRRKKSGGPRRGRAPRRARPGLVGTVVLQRACAEVGQPLELDQVERFDEDAIAGPVRLDRGAAKCLAEIRDVPLHEVRSARRRIVGPDLVDDPGRGHDGVRAHEQADEDCPLPCTAEVDGSTVDACLQGAEDPVVDRRPRAPARALLARADPASPRVCRVLPL